MQNTYLTGENISGDLKLVLKSGELLPADTKIIVEQPSGVKEFLLSDFFNVRNENISEHPKNPANEQEGFFGLTSGEYYAEGFNISGQGDGIGFAGEKTIYPNVYFTLLLSETSLNETTNNETLVINNESSGSSGQVAETEVSQENQSQEQQVVDTSTETSTEAPQEQTQTEASVETSSETPAELPVEPVPVEVSSESPITGAVILQGEQEAEGVVSANQLFNYNVGDYFYSIKPDSIRSDYENLSSSVLESNLENGALTVTTNYYYTEKGFGKDYLGNENELKLPLDKLALKAENGALRIRLVYGKDVFAEESKDISVENLTEKIRSETLINKTGNETLKRYNVVINHQVKWQKKISVENLSEISVELPKEAENISVKTGYEIAVAEQQAQQEANTVQENKNNLITGNVILNSDNKGILSDIWKKLTGSITGKVTEDFQSVIETNDSKIISVNLDKTTDEILVEYTTPGPVANETNISGGKSVVISASSELNYTDILAYSELDNKIKLEDKNKIKLYHVVNGSKEETSFDAYDLDEDGSIDYIEWNVPHLSEQTYEIIYITKAEHLDSSKNFIENVYDYVKTKDNNWTTIPSGDYVRIRFEKNLTNKNDITIYARGNNSQVEVLKENGNETLAVFNNLNGGMNKILLTALNDNESYATFDLKSFGDVEYDYIVDPTTGEEAQLCDQGDNNTSCNITTSHINITDGAVFYFNNLNIKMGGSLANLTANCSGTSHGCGFSLVLTGNLTIYPGGNITAGNISITAANVDVQANSTKTGKIITDGLGWMPGNGQGFDPALSQGSYGSISWPSQNWTKWVYGNASSPSDFGSGGYSLAGGGIIFINASNNLTVNGIVTSDGVYGSGSTYTGSGGSVWLISNIFEGGGNISASIGSDSRDASGGRIRTTYTTNTFNGFIKVSGARQRFHGSYSFTDGSSVNLTVKANMALAGGTYTLNTLNITNNAILEVQPNSFTGNGSGVVINCVNAYIDSGAKISGDFLGFIFKTGPGFGANGDSSHGGLGGGQTSLAKTYGSETYPVSLGSGGYGYNGGGAIFLNCTGNVTINGNISMLSTDVTGNDYTGAGGSILIVANNLIVNSTLNARGANAGNRQGGGGGRIALHASTMTLLSQIIDNGGTKTTGSEGSAGTIYINASTSITSTGNVTATGYNGTTARINITAPLMTLSGIYNATYTNQSKAGLVNGTITIGNFTDCTSTFTGTFVPTPIWLNTTVCGGADTIYPIVNITYPLNTTYNINVSNLNYTITEANPSRCWWSNNSGAWNSTSVAAGTNWTGLASIEGSNTWTVYCNDSSNNMNSSSVTFVKDTIYPQFSTYWDNNATLVNSGIALFNVTVINTNGTVLLEINNTNITATNLTGNVYNASYNFTNSGTYTYRWISWGNGTSRLYNVSENKYYVVNASVADTITPGINFTFPTLANGTSTTNTSIEINVSISEPNLQEVKFNWNGTNYTIYDDSLVLMMNFENLSSLGESASKVVDVSKYGNNGTYQGNAKFNSSGKYGGCGNFPGASGDKLLLPTIPFNNFTVLMWVNLNALGTNDNFIGEFDTGGWLFRQAVANSALLEFYNVATAYTTTSGVLEADKWMYLGVSYDGSVYRMYVNATPVYTSSASQAGVTHRTNLAIGGIPANTYEINGRIDEVQIWNRSLSASEINQLYMSNLQKYNQTQWNLYVNQSKNSTAGLDYGTYNYFASAKDTSGNENITETRTVTITAQDTTYPIFSNNITSPANNSQYNSGNIYQFNITILNTNGTAGIEFNSINYTMSNLSSVFNKTLSGLSAGTYSYYFWGYGNGTSHLYNVSQTYSYTIAQNITSLGLSATTPIEYPALTDFAGTGCNSQISCTLNLTNGIFGAGTISANYSTVGNANYTGSSAVFAVTINKNSTLVLGLSATTPITYGTATDVAGSGCPSQLSCSLDKANATYGVGTITFNYSTAGNTNYTANSITKDIIINQAPSSVYTYLNNSRDNLTINSGTSVWLNGSRIAGEGSIYLYNNGTLINSDGSIGNYTLFSNVGLYNITTIYPSTQNYSASYETWWLNVTQASIAISISLSPQLSQQTIWNIVSLPMFNQSADGNNADGATNYYINISATGGTADLYVKASGDLMTSGNDVLGLGNETYSNSSSDSSVPSSQKSSLTTNYADNKIGGSLNDGDVVYLKFFLSAPSAQSSGNYNNTILFEAVPHGQTP